MRGQKSGSNYARDVRSPQFAGKYDPMKPNRGRVCEPEKGWLVSKLRGTRERRKAETGKRGGRHSYLERGDVILSVTATLFSVRSMHLVSTLCAKFSALLPVSKRDFLDTRLERKIISPFSSWTAQRSRSDAYGRVWFWPIATGDLRKLSDHCCRCFFCKHDPRRRPDTVADVGLGLIERDFVKGGTSAFWCEQTCHWQSRRALPLSSVSTFKFVEPGEAFCCGVPAERKVEAFGIAEICAGFIIVPDDSFRHGGETPFSAAGFGVRFMIAPSSTAAFAQRRPAQRNMSSGTT